MQTQVDMIIQRTGLSLTPLPIKYLGVPLFKGRAKLDYFMELEANFTKRISGWRSRLLSFGGKLTLLKSVLTAVPIHSLSIIKAPRTLFKRLDKYMANFLWNSNDRTKKRWVAWDVVCRPISEGGLGIRPLPQIMQALHAKRCWSLIQGNSVWAHYMLRKYGDPRDNNYKTPTAPSPLWRSMLSIFQKVYNHCLWIVGRGHIPVWGSNWCGTILSRPTDIGYSPNINQIISSPLIKNKIGRLVNIRNLLPGEAISTLDKIIINEEPDRIIWTNTQHGYFSTSSYWELYRIRHDKCSWSRYCWNKYIPSRIGFFLWRLSRNALPVEAKLRSMGFSLPSKCVCCVNPAVETLDHLFVAGEVASGIWQHFAGLFQLRTQIQSINELIEVWFHNTSLNNVLGVTKNLILGFCLWEIWKQRNNIIFDNGRANSKLIIDYVNLETQRHLRAHKLADAQDGIIEDTREEDGSDTFAAAQRNAGQSGSDLRPQQNSNQDAAAATNLLQTADGTPPLHDRERHGVAALDNAAAVQHSAGRYSSAPCHLQHKLDRTQIQQGDSQVTAAAVPFQQDMAELDPEQLGAAQMEPHSYITGHQPAVSPSTRIQIWTAPVEGLKLNIEGCSGKPTYTAGGGIVRDDTGAFIGAFTLFINNTASSVPALDALQFAATLGKAKGWDIKEIETTSQHLTNIMSAKKAPPWALIYKLRQIQTNLMPPRSHPFNLPKS